MVSLNTQQALKINVHKGKRKSLSTTQVVLITQLTGYKNFPYFRRLLKCLRQGTNGCVRGKYKVNAPKLFLLQYVRTTIIRSSFISTVINIMHFSLSNCDNVYYLRAMSEKLLLHILLHSFGFSIDLKFQFQFEDDTKEVTCYGTVLFVCPKQ